MKKSFIKLISTVVLLILVTATILSSLTSCLYIAGSKDEINSNINQSVNENPTERSTVAEYLRDWGMPKFDTIKFSYIESCFIQLYNYGEGLPKTKDHAVATANLFVEKYYDTIDHNDKTAVTDALLYCYVEAIGDPYSIYRPPVEADEYEMDMSGKFGGIGVVVQYNHNDESIMIETVYPHSPGEAAGLKVGDIFYSIDGKTVAEIGYLNAVYHIRGKIGSTVEITVIRDGKYVTVTATRDEIEEINVDYEIDESNNIGYVQIVAFKKNTAEQDRKSVV